MYFPKRSSFLEKLPVNEFRWKSLMAVLPAYDEVRRRCSRNEARIHRDNAVKSMLRPGVATILFHDFFVYFFSFSFLFFFFFFSFFFVQRPTRSIADKLFRPARFLRVLITTFEQKESIGSFSRWVYRNNRKKGGGKQSREFYTGIKIGRAMISLI